jgi:membrane AbrB-like protein
MMNLLITLIVGIIGGIAFLRLKIPAGAMIGSMLAVALFNIITGNAYLPLSTKIITQIAAGAFIGAGIKRKDIMDMRFMIKPALLMVSLMISLDLLIGYIMFRTTGIDLVTALFACAPGGLVDMALISNDFGADSSKVAILQLVRLIGVMMLLPAIIKYVSTQVTISYIGVECESSTVQSVNLKVEETIKAKYTEKQNRLNIFLTLFIAFLGGLTGYKLGIPAGALSFSMVAVSSFNIFTARGYMPVNIRRFTQVCAGALIGERMTLADVLALRNVMIPACILLFGIIIVNLFLGFIMSKVSKLEIVTSLMASVPGGVADMALIAKDLGGDVPKVAILQLARYICVIVVYPIIVKTIFL